MSNISEEIVTRIFGSLDDIVVAEIIATGATRDEMVAANAWINRDEVDAVADRALPAGAMAKVVHIVERVRIAKKHPIVGSLLGEGGSSLE